MPEFLQFLISQIPLLILSALQERRYNKLYALTEKIVDDIGKVILK